MNNSATLHWSYSKENNTKKISEQAPLVDSVFALIKHWYVRLIVP